MGRRLIEVIRQNTVHSRYRNETFLSLNNHLIDETCDGINSTVTGWGSWGADNEALPVMSLFEEHVLISQIEVAELKYHDTSIEECDRLDLTLKDDL